ncbi:MAG: hypothetical protein WCK43_04720, partial [bacterium]
MTSVISKSKKSLCLLYVFLFSSFLHASITEECLDYLRAPLIIHFVSTQKQTLIDPKIHYNHPTESLKDSFKDYYPSFIKGFDDSIEDIFFNTPFEKRKDKWENFRKDHQLSEEDAKAVEAYYSLLIFDGHPDYVDPASKQEAFQTVKKLSLEDLLKDPQRKQRYDYYQQSLGKLSVPEMAEELKITQGKVYQELSFYNLFITEAFNGNYGEGETQASRFIRHHDGLENRGVAWERFKDGEKEGALLVHFLNQGLTHAEIAAKLNELFETTNPTDPDIRTEKSVSQKIISLGLAQSSPRSLPDLNIDPYGHVKVGAKLVSATATQFIFDHKEKGFDWCAK